MLCLSFKIENLLAIMGSRWFKCGGAALSLFSGFACFRFRLLEFRDLLSELLLGLLHVVPVVACLVRFAN